MTRGRTLVLLCGLVAAPTYAQRIPGVDVWLVTPADSVAPGDRIPAYAIADPGAYLVVFRVTAGNHVVVVVPRTPYGGYRVPSQGLRSNGVDVSFRGSALDSTGHLFAAASYTPFDFSHVRVKGGWDTTRLVAPATLTPVDAADWFLRRIVPSRRTAYSVNDVAYYVGVSPPPAVVRGNGGDTAAGSAGTGVSQSTVVYVVPGNDDVSYDTDPWGYYTRYYWYDPYASNSYSRYKRRCPDGSAVPRNAPCPGVVIGIPAPPRTPVGTRRPVPHRPYPLRTLPAQPQGRIFSAPLRRQPMSPGTTIIVPTTQAPPVQQSGRHVVPGGYLTVPRTTPTPSTPPVVRSIPAGRPAPVVTRPAPAAVHPAPPPPAPSVHATNAPMSAPRPPHDRSPVKTP